MDSNVAFLRFEQYLKSHQIRYFLDRDDETERISMCYSGCQNCPDNTLEACIWFYEGSMEARVYFDKNASGWVRKHSAQHAALYRLLNYINASVWLTLSDGSGSGLYKPSHLYTPRLYITEDECYDITLATIIPYDFYELAPLETEDYITAYCPELMDRIWLTIAVRAFAI